MTPRLEDDPGAVTVRYGGLRTGVQIGILTLLIFFGGYVLLFSDRHNDGRYVSREEYSKDRENDKELRTLDKSALAARLDAQDRTLEEIKRDVKAILFHQAGVTP
jgi:hypothetical protein